MRFFLLTVSLILSVIVCEGVKYEPKWESLDTRPLPQWFDDAKIGIFIHWGVFSVPAVLSEWFWNSWTAGNSEYVNYMKKNYRPGFTYQEFAKDFKATFYNPKDWATLFQKSGAKYVVLTSNYHDGYALWPSSYSYSWNSQDIGAHTDLLGELANAIRNHTDLKFGVHHALAEWYNPMFLDDKKSNFKNNTFVVDKVYPEMMELVENYHPDIIWSNVGVQGVPDTYWKSTEFLAWLYNESPVKDTVVVNDRWGGNERPCRHGDFVSCSYHFPQQQKWENAIRLDKKSWGYRKDSHIGDYLSTYELLTTMVKTVSNGGNLLINVGPTSDGVITPVFEERLLDLGNWLSINGESIYSTKPWIYQQDNLTDVWYTTKESIVYAFLLEWPSENLLQLGRVSNLFKTTNIAISLLGNSEKLKRKRFLDKVEIRLPEKNAAKNQLVWVIKMEEKNIECFRKNRSSTRV